MEDWAGVEKLHQFNRYSDTPKTVLVESYDNMSSGTVAIFPRQSSSPSLLSTFHCLMQQLVLFGLIFFMTFVCWQSVMECANTLLASVKISVPLLVQN